ncbi:MAG TPA: M28 family peptidase [Phycisphaerae bacterium]|jgi:Zn-dependent M28 family amino/carboxypeptidase|nr:M28 family peptidase [Phycisphaerae bacterium]
MPSTIDAAVAYIEQQFAGMGDTVTRETYRVDGTDAHNLVFERRGSKFPDKILVIGAHYDTEEITPGADDNASAVAALIESARLVAPLKPRRTIRFVSFPCEEQPHMEEGTMGSQHHARMCRQRGDDLVGMICLEMLGFYSSAPESQGVPPGIPRALRWAFPTCGNFLASVANLHSLRLLAGFHRGFKSATRLRLFSVPLPEKIREIRRSDNSSFWDQGYPALMITDTSFLRNPNYHQPTDTPDTLDYDRLAQATLGVAGAIARIGRCK